MPSRVVCRSTRADLANYFRKYTVLFDSASDVFSLISPQDSEFLGFFRDTPLVFA